MYALAIHSRHETKRRALLSVAVALCVLGASPSAEAGKARRAGGQKPGGNAVALFPVVARGKPAPALVDAVQAALTRGVERAGIVVVQGEALLARLRQAPPGAIENCDGETACVAKLGKAAGVAEVIHAVAQAAGAGIKVDLMAVQVAGAKQERAASFELSAAADADKALGAPFEVVFKTPLPPAPAPAAQADLELVPLEDLGGPALEPLAPLEPIGGKGGGTAKAGSTAGSGTSGGTTGGGNGSGAGSAATTTQVNAAPAGGGTQTAAATPGGQPAAVERTPVLLYAGVGVVVLALAAGAGGVMQGMAAQDHYDKANAEDKDGNLVASMPSAKKLQGQGDKATDRANLLYGIGTGLLVVGAGLMAFDILWLGAETSVAVGDGGAQALATWRW